MPHTARRPATFAHLAGSTTRARTDSPGPWETHEASEDDPDTLRCRTCQGTGSVPFDGQAQRTCPQCEGSGQEPADECWSCNGTGQKYEGACSRCDGTGLLYPDGTAVKGQHADAGFAARVKAAVAKVRGGSS